MRSVLVVVCLVSGCGGGSTGGSSDVTEPDAGMIDAGQMRHAEWMASQKCQDTVSTPGHTTAIFTLADVYTPRHAAEWITVKSTFDDDTSTEETETINNPQVTPALTWSRPTARQWVKMSVVVSTSGAITVKQTDVHPGEGDVCP